MVNHGKPSDRDHAGGSLALIVNGDGKVTNRYLYGALVDEVLAEETLAYDADNNVTSEVLWALSDHQGSVRDWAKFGTEVSVVKHVDYDPFGNVIAQTPTDAAIATMFGYTGRSTDPLTKLQDNRARPYDPTLGRFISQDPMGFDAGDANPYRYVGNHASYATDPSGLEGRYANAAKGGHSVDDDGIVRKVGNIDINPIPIDSLPVILKLAVENGISAHSSGDGRFQVPWNGGVREVHDRRLTRFLIHDEAIKSKVPIADMVHETADYILYYVPEPVLQRAPYAAQAGGAFLEGMTGAGVAMIPSPGLTQVGGGAIIVHAVDQGGSAVYGLIFGESSQTFTSYGIEQAAGLVVNDPASKRMIGDGGDMLVSFIGPGAVSRGPRILSMTPEWVLVEKNAAWLDSDLGRFVIPGARVGDTMHSVEELEAYADHFGHAWASGNRLLTASGWGKLNEIPAELQRIPYDDVRAMYGGFVESGRDFGNPGLYFGTHAEPQLLTAQPNLFALNVSQSPCPKSCNAVFLPSFAKMQGRSLMVGHPKGVSIYRPNQSVQLVPNAAIPDGSIVQVPGYSLYFVMPGVANASSKFNSH